MPASELTIPCHWNKTVMKQILSDSILQDGIPVREVYGVLASGPVGHGRLASTVPSVSKDDAVSFRKWLKEQKVSFSYLLNAPFTLGTDATHRVLDCHLDWVFGEMQPDSVTVSSLDLMKYIRRRGYETGINISTIAAVKSVDDLDRYMDVRPSKVVVHHDLGKDWTRLRELTLFGRRQSVEIELLVNESCLLHCQDRARHYAYLSQVAQHLSDVPFMTGCNARKLVRPREFLLSGGAVRPEDLRIFEEMGVSRFKIAGRDRAAEWLPRVVEAYQGRHYEGNFIRLLDIAPSLRAEGWIWLRNAALDGFLEGFPCPNLYEEQINYCDRWVIRLYLEGDFHVNGTKFEIKDGSLVLSQPGREVRAILNK